MKRHLRRAAVLTVALIWVSSVATASPSEEAAFVDAINQERIERGLSPLVPNADLVEGAREQANRIAQAGHLFHNTDLGSITDGWYLIGENVGMGGDVASLHAAFMASPAHKENLLKANYDSIGVGVAYAGDTLVVSEVFMDAIVDPEAEVGLGSPAEFTPPFKDDDGSIHESDIVELFEAGVTVGCGPDIFCPDRSMTRGEMATMFSRAFDIPVSTVDRFVDDNASVHQSAINGLATAGITKGCAPDRFCPERPVSRGELASLLVRLLRIDPVSGSDFSDIAGSVHAGDINALAAAGIAKGCSQQTYCPDQSVTRAQMASFVVRVLARG